MKQLPEKFSVYAATLEEAKYITRKQKELWGCFSSKDVEGFPELAQKPANITREIAIGFGEWLKENYCPGSDSDIPKMIYWCLQENIIHDREYTTEELFDKYIESLK